MNNIGKFLFLHFEKGLVGLLFLGFAYSLVWYGPWRGGRDYDTELTKIALIVENKTPVQAPKPADDMYAALIKTGELTTVPEPIPDSLLWTLIKLDAPKVLPPVDIACRPERGYIAVKWAVNPNQPALGDAIQFVGVQIERAAMTPDGPGSFEVLTQVESQSFMTPTQLYERAKAVMAVTLEREQVTRGPSRTAGAEVAALDAPWSVEDLFNALHDGVISESRLRSLVAQGMREGYYTQMDRMGMNEVFQQMPEVRREARRQILETRRLRGDTSRSISAADLFKTSLELMGFTGGGEYVKRMTLPEDIGEPSSDTAKAPSTSAPVEKPKTPDVPVVAWNEITMFADTRVTSDVEYVYRVRFWAADSSGGQRQLMSTDWSQESRKTAPRPDTEFYLTGILPDQGKAAMLVRKWMYARNGWEMRTYYLGPGEQIGRAEVLPKRDTRGNTIMDAANKPVMETVDFSTGCVLLSARSRPRSVETRRTTAEVAPTGEIKSVDNVDYVLYDTPQIVYADRKGNLRVKWKAPPTEL